MELSDKGIENLMIAVTERAYADYVLGGLLLKRCEYEEVNGVIHVTKFGGHNVGDGRRRRAIDNKLRLYSTAKSFFEGTSWGEYLMRKGNEEIAGNNFPRKTRRYEYGQTKRKKGEIE